MEKDLKTRELSQCTFKPSVNPKSARIVGELEAKMRESQAERWGEGPFDERGVIEILPVPLESERTLSSRAVEHPRPPAYHPSGSSRNLSYHAGVSKTFDQQQPSPTRRLFSQKLASLEMCTP